MLKANANPQSEAQRLHVERGTRTQRMALESERTASICATSRAPAEQGPLRQVP
jgi:hypothetical protein